MKIFLNNFLLMFQFLTRIPINKSLKCQQENFRYGAVFLPIVGLVIGGIQWIFYYILGQVLPSNITAVFVVLAGVIVTGALHVDGLGDTCDGFFAFKGRDRIIEIMKDSRIGTFACIALVGDMALKIMSTDVLVKNRAGLMIIAAPVIGRFSIEFISLIANPAKSTGSGNLFIGNMSVGIVVLSGLLTAVISFLIIGTKSTIVIMPSALILTIMINLYSKSKIGGLTGDLLGANNELVEILSMLLFIAINHL